MNVACCVAVKNLQNRWVCHCLFLDVLIPGGSMDTVELNIIIFELHQCFSISYNSNMKDKASHLMVHKAVKHCQ